jgi:outer membrane protein insertion porin family
MRSKFASVGALLLVAVVLGLTAPARAQVVSQIDVQGNEAVSRDRILLSFGIRLNEDLAIEQVREGIRRLYAMGQFSDVSVHGEEREDGTLRLVVDVKERPRVSAVDVRGSDKITKSDVEDAISLKRGSPFDSSVLEDSRVAVLDLYRKKGFPEATVETGTEEATGNAVRVVFDIVEGTRVRVKKIAFEGNASIDSGDLRKVMETKEDRWWRTNAYFDADVLSADLKKVTDRYREDGFIDAAVTGYDTAYDDKGEQVTITIHVVEGPLYEVSAIDWEGASDFAIVALNDLTKLDVGETYRPSEADDTIREAYGWYGERGYIHARISKAEDVEEGNKVRITFHVDESEPARVGQIRITGNERTKEKVIRRELSIRPGDLYRTSEVIASQRSVANLGFFDGPGVQFAESTDPNDVDLIFNVKERQTGRAGVGVSSTSDKGITGFLELTNGNLLGNGQYLDLKWEFGKKTSEVVLGFTEPWFLDRHLSLGFDVYDTDDKRVYGDLPTSFYDETFDGTPEYDPVVNCENCDRYYVVQRDRRGGDVRIGWPFLGSRFTTIYGKYTLEQFKLKEYATITSDVVDSLGQVIDTNSADYSRYDPGWEWRSGVTATIVRRSTDRRFHPHVGNYSRATAELFGAALGGDVEYQRYVIDSREFMPSIWMTTLMLRARAGIVTGYGDPATVPEDTRFELGGVGVNGVRGYENNDILPEGSDLYGGRTMLLGSAELQFPITNETEQIPVYGLFFVDAGNTWDSWADTDPGKLYWGAGAGVRVEMPVLGNLGIDMGYGFDDEKGGKWVVHYQLGLDY